MKWRDMGKEAQKALSRASVAAGRTCIERWSDRADQVSKGRLERARIAASFIRPGLRLADIGCGEAMPLATVLPPETHYVPVDVVRRDHRTIVVDLNLEPLPPLDVDVIVALGLLEYLNDVPGLLKQLPCDAVISYAPVENLPTRDRASSGWKNSYTTASLSTLFEEANFKIEALLPCPGKQRVWNLKRR